jgi:hypothetical protein
MIALLYFVFLFLIYLPISIWVIRKSYRFAKDKYQRGWVGGIVAALFMYNLVFWDWIPVILIHKHLCETEGGFWVYKTPEQWVKEHPEVLGQDWGDSTKTKWENIRKDYGNQLYRIWYGPHIYIEYGHKTKIDFTDTISQYERKAVDGITGEILFKSKNFIKDAQIKLWLAERSRSEGPGCGESEKNGFLKEHKKLKLLVKGDNK